MEIKLDQVLEENNVKQDSLDMPDCFGEFDKENRLCISYCGISIKCCVMQTRHPKVDILEKLLIYNDYSVKPH
ncbi:MAG: hypothetical protein MI863_08170 [Desulfobacterales bacterium]|nr:hypothetical protein [Desulfobacterales bacterium]